MVLKNFNELQDALFQGQTLLEIDCNITCIHSLILPPGTTLIGKLLPNGETPTLFFNTTDGIGLTSNNTIESLNITTNASNKSIYNAKVSDDLGYFYFKNLQLTGQFSFIARKGVLKADITLQNIVIHTADARHYLEQPQKYGVNVLQGALTIYNVNTDPSSLISVKASHISIGHKNMPVLGSGIFIAGAGDTGGRVYIDKLHTLAVYSTGNIPYGVPDFITAAVFIVTGAYAKEVIHDGEIITYGVNDMVLDAWGEVGTWISHKPIISYGPSGIGFVNFGKVGKFIVNDKLETYGLGARGYNQYDGTVDEISFQSITTYGNGSVGIQISQPIGDLTVHGNITTYGEIGNSLVKGANVDLPATALSIKAGADIKSITVKGNIISKGKGIKAYSLEEGGVIHAFDVVGKIEPKSE